ncbi:MAG: helix-turn-helix transcriptional regulator [Clostridia bacterium]|nr:helix-turn-helix transcriptional regulator [Clostridia bacterium]
MSFERFPKSLRQRLNRMYIPDIIDPYHIKIHWIKSVIPKEETVFISKESHIHNFFELHIMAEGFFEYTFGDGKEFRLSESNALLIPPKEAHTISSFLDGANKITISFTPDKDSPLYVTLKKFGISSLPVSEKIYSLMEDIFKESEINTTVSPYVIRNKIFEILIEFARIANLPGAIPRSDAAIEDRRVTAAKLYIRNNSNRLIKLDEVASHCGVSAKQMDRIFLSCHGCHLSEYIKHTRLSEAEKLLLETKIPIKEISEKLGFSNVYNFTSFFKKRVGITPAAYRNADTVKEK